MKRLLLLAALALLLPALPAKADGSGHTWDVLVVDKDPKGTNVRAAPSGQVIKVIAFTGNAGLRSVKISAQADGWFKVAVGGTVGWMHGSVLGTCAAATEDGAPALSQKPQNDSPANTRIPAGAPVSLLDMQNEWLKVRSVDAKGKSHDGWLPEQALAMSEAEREACAKAWARK